MNKFKSVYELSELLKPQLPPVITKEELMNHYLHKMKLKRNHEMSISVNLLIIAAHLAEKKVQGSSILEINVTPKEKLEYIRSSRNADLDRAGFRNHLYKCKDEIVAMFKSGASQVEIAKSVGCSPSTINNYLVEFGVLIRKKRRRRKKSE